MSASDVEIYDKAQVRVDIHRGKGDIEDTEENRFLDLLPSAWRLTWEGVRGSYIATYNNVKFLDFLASSLF